MKLICIGNYPPRQCGIATFTENLLSAIEAANIANDGSLQIEVVAMNDRDQQYPYPEIVKYTIPDQDKASYVSMAQTINASGADVCLLQHEFGIFGGDSGLLLLSLLRRLEVPLVVTMHTVLEKPNFHQREVLTRIGQYAQRVVVMNPLAIDFLTDIYQVPRERIAIIEHGMPDFKLAEDKLLPRPQAWENRTVLLTFGLIGRSKGIETVIRALPELVKESPQLLYVVLGKTHPNIVKNQGEEYRQSLEKLVEDEGLNGHVQFINQYVDELELMSYLKHAEMYVTPYWNKAQITSGTLSYAVAAGCAVISTPYWHAESLLAEGRGLFFNFGDYRQLAERIRQLMTHPEAMHRLQQQAETYGRGIVWLQVGAAYLQVFSQLKRNLPPAVKPFRSPEIELTHLLRLTDFTGVIQHARSTVPWYKSGYCVDDAARALLVATHWHLRHRDEISRELIIRYLAFLQLMSQKDGNFLNYLSYDKSVNEPDESDDAFGRAYWALGYLIAAAPDDGILQAGLTHFSFATRHLSKLRYARGYANSLMGLYHYVKRFPDQESYLYLADEMAEKLCQRFVQHSRENWQWFEDSLTYDNGLLPAALYKAYELFGKKHYLEIADKSRVFLESKCFVYPWLSLIGNRKWLHFDADYEIFAQQPIDASAMVLLYESAYKATKNTLFITKMMLSYQWFFGENDLNIGLYDAHSKGCNDGLEEMNVNINQGAESTLAFLLASLVVKDYE